MKLSEPIHIRHFSEFSSCPIYAKFNWDNHEQESHDPVYKASREVIMSCFRDMQNLDKKVRYATVRSRVHKEFAPYCQDMHISQYLKKVKQLLEQIRSWYLTSFREGPTTCLTDLQVEFSVPAPGLRVTGGIDVVTLSEPGLASIVEITDKFKDKSEAFRDFELRSKVYLMKKNGIDIQKLTVINIKNGKLDVWNYHIHDLEDFIYKTDVVMNVIGTQIKKRIFYPSISNACNTCPYRRICSW